MVNISLLLRFLNYKFLNLEHFFPYQESHPSPGKPFRGGTFEAFFPNCDTVQQLLPRLHKAFKKGLTFTVKGKETDAKVDWNCIPHKTSLCEGKAK